MWLWRPTTSWPRRGAPIDAPSCGSCRRWRRRGRCGATGAASWTSSLRPSARCGFQSLQTCSLINIVTHLQHRMHSDGVAAAMPPRPGVHCRSARSAHRRCYCIASFFQRVRFAIRRCHVQAVLTAGADATLRLWAVRDGTCLRTFSGLGAAALRIRFVALGTQIVSTGGDGLLKIWSVASGACQAMVQRSPWPAGCVVGKLVACTQPCLTSTSIACPILPVSHCSMLSK